MSNVHWDMISCDHGAVALVARQARLLRVCFERSPEEVSSMIMRLHPGAKRISQPFLQAGLQQLTEYFLGKRQMFTVPLETDGLSAFACEVHQALVKVPYGELVTYGELAASVLSPKAARAVGRVMSANPFPLIVPCHRVVNADGKIGHYSAAHGSATKAWLIDFEQKSVASKSS